MHCAPSARLQRILGIGESKYTREGRLAHKVAAAALTLKTCAPFRAPYAEEIMKQGDREMVAAAKRYAGYVAKTVKSADIHIEQRLWLAKWLPEGFGTADAYATVGRAGKTTLHVFDYKYGAGMRVDAFRNPQLMLYALGALHELNALNGENPYWACLHIYQPRIGSGLDPASTYSVSCAELLDWGERELAPLANAAYIGNGEHEAGEWCRWCDAKPLCRAWNEEARNCERAATLASAMIGPKETAEWLERAPKLISWLKGIQEYAKRLAGAGETLPGFEVCEGRADRDWVDEEAAIQAARDAGIPDADLIRHKCATPAQLESLMGKERFARTMGEHVRTTRPPALRAIKTADAFAPVEGAESASTNK
jgi:hypothetical protein